MGAIRIGVFDSRQPVGAGELLDGIAEIQQMIGASASGVARPDPVKATVLVGGVPYSGDLVALALPIDEGAG